MKIKTLLGPEMANSETQVHKMYLFFMWALKISTFLSQMALASLAAIFRTQKILILKAHPLPKVLAIFLPASLKSLCPAPYKQQVHE
jgi:hypothetical protein